MTRNYERAFEERLAAAALLEPDLREVLVVGRPIADE
jgi:hypothetical protein